MSMENYHGLDTEEGAENIPARLTRQELLDGYRDNARAWVRLFGEDHPDGRIGQFRAGMQTLVAFRALEEAVVADNPNVEPEPMICPIPVGVYWNGLGGNFYSMQSRRGMGDDFWKLWYNRRHEFPTEVNTPKRRNFLDTLPVDRDDALTIISGFMRLAFGQRHYTLADIHQTDLDILRGNVERAFALLQNQPVVAPGRNRMGMQPWTLDCSVMMQSVMMSAIRGLDGLAKLHKAKMLIRFYRRSILLSAFDQAPINDAYSPGGGDFTGPSFVWKHIIPHPPRYIFENTGHTEETEENAMRRMASDFIQSRDEMPLHYFTHMMHAFHIVAVFHPVEEIAAFWREVYNRMVHALHLSVEPDDAMKLRLSDDPQAWKARSNEAGSCQT